MEFDAPLFKRLAPNDTRQTVGKQSGVLIPNALRNFFPKLHRTIPEQPAMHIGMTALLAVNGAELGRTLTSYQYQTRNGSRPPEWRLTGGLSPIMRQAHGGDILLIRRGIDNPLLLHLELISRLDGSGRETRRYRELLRLTGPRKWGVLDPRASPVNELDVAEEIQEQQARQQQAFELFDQAARHQEIRSRSIARSRAFGNQLLPLYDNRCAVCGNGLHTAEGLHEVHAAHIIPRSLKGFDDCRNGIALCHSHHWAFDNGLFGIDCSRQVVLRPTIVRDLRNDHMTRLEGVKIREPNDLQLRPADAALEWHRINIVGIR